MVVGVCEVDILFSLMCFGVIIRYFDEIGSVDKDSSISIEGNRLSGIYGIDQNSTLTIAKQILNGVCTVHSPNVSDL